MTALKIKWLYAPLLFLMTLLFLPSMADAETFTGKIVGLYCAMYGKECGSEQQLILDTDLVLRQEDGDYFPLLNIPRDAKVRYAQQEVKIEGNLVEKYHAIDVEEIKVMRGDDYETAWSREDYQRRLQRRYGAPPAGGGGF